MENDIRNLIVEHLVKYKIHTTFDKLKTTIQQQLLQIEQYFQRYIEEQIKLAEKLKKQKINIASVCANTKIPRSSVYNSADVLKKYINERINDIEQEGLLPFNKYKKIYEEFGLLKSYLEDAKVQIVASDALELKIYELEQEIAELNKANKKYAQEISKLSIENENLKLKFRVKKNNIIKFGDTNT